MKEPVQDSELIKYFGINLQSGFLQVQLGQVAQWEHTLIMSFIGKGQEEDGAEKCNQFFHINLSTML